MIDFNTLLTNFPKCDICDNPATSMARDYEEIDSQGGMACFQPVGKPRKGCDDHKVTPSRQMYKDKK
jgi:hypothetical protein